MAIFYRLTPSYSLIDELARWSDGQN